MPGGFPSHQGVCNYTHYGLSSGVDGLAVAASTTANTKGNWVEVVAATDHDAVAITVEVMRSSQTNYNKSIDIGIGALGVEKVIVGDLWWSHNEPAADCWMIPVAIEAGTRITARIQANGVAGDSLYTTVGIFDGVFGAMGGCAGFEAIGFNSAATIGADIDPGATAHTKGAYTELIASTTKDYFGILPMFGANGGTASTGMWTGLCDIAVGASGQEKIIIPNIPCSRSQGTSQNGGIIYGPCGNTNFCPVNIPAGSRIAARSQSSSIVSSDRHIWLALGGLYK